MRKKAQAKKEVPGEVPDNTVFWAIVGIITVFILVLAVVVFVRSSAAGGIVYQWGPTVRPFSINPYACLDVPPCGDGISWMCCAEQPLPGSNRKCTAPLKSYAVTPTMGYPDAYANYGAGQPICPSAMPYRCTCPEKYQYRQSWPVPSQVIN